MKALIFIGVFSLVMTFPAFGESPSPNKLQIERVSINSGTRKAGKVIKKAKKKRRGKRGSRGISSKCLPSVLKTRLAQVEKRWGKVRVISTHRPGAKLKSGRPSKHATCRAVDFVPPKGTYGAVAKWLKANHKGGVGTYSGKFHHIHIDTGKPYRWHN